MTIWGDEKLVGHPHDEPAAELVYRSLSPLRVPAAPRITWARNVEDDEILSMRYSPAAGYSMCLFIGILWIMYQILPGPDSPPLLQRRTWE